MGIFSTEFNTGSIKLLYSSPISNRQIVLGKYLSLIVFNFVLIVICLILGAYAGFGIENMEWTIFLSGVLGIFLLVAAYSAIGLFISSLTSYQIVAAIGTFSVLYLLNATSKIGQTIDFVRDITYWLCLSGRFATFQKGLLCSEDILYFILVPALFVSFTIFKLQFKRERSKTIYSVLKYMGAFLIVGIIGALSNRPSVKKFYDVTRTKHETVTPKTQEILSKINGEATVVTFCNIFDRDFFIGSKRNVKVDNNRFTNYIRFKPDIKIKYIYYHALPTRTRSMESLIKNDSITYEDLVQRYCVLTRMDRDEVMSVEEVKKKYEVDLKSEQYRFCRQIRSEDGKTSMLRIFDDIYVHPDESQKSAAFRGLVKKLPVVAFASGNGEREIEDKGERGFYQCTIKRGYRSSLINNGFDFETISLKNEISNDVDILVIAEPRQMYSEIELHNLNKYIDNGGNLIMMADANRQDIMNPLVSRFGISFMEGQVVEKNKGYSDNLVTCKFTPAANQMSYLFAGVSNSYGVVTMENVLGIDYSKADSDYRVVPLLFSDQICPDNSKGSWVEKTTTNFTDELALFNAEKDVPGSITTCLSLERKGNEKSQKIIIIGDAGLFSNAELSRSRTGINTKNTGFMKGIFHWMSDYELPVDIRRPARTDNRFLVKTKTNNIFNWLFKAVFPLLILGIGFRIWYRRKNQ